MTHVTALSKTDAAALVTDLSRQLADLRKANMDLEQWGLERIKDQEKIIKDLRARLAECLGIAE